MRRLKLVAAAIMLILCVLPVMSSTRAQSNTTITNDSRPEVKKVLFIGDSMTGWLAERLNAYANENDFTVSAVVWDGSTIQKWGSATRFGSIIKENDPDVIFVSLGMNELFETNPSRFQTSLDNIKKNAGSVPIIWIGPLNWPGYDKGEPMNKWLAKEMGTGHYFNSFDLEIDRQSAKNPHPTREGMIEWMDDVIKWVKTYGAVRLPGYNTPVNEKMSRPKSFIYKRMKETL